MQLSIAFIIVYFSCSVANAGPIVAKLMLFHAPASKTTVFSPPSVLTVSKESRIDKRCQPQRTQKDLLAGNVDLLTGEVFRKYNEA